MTTVAVELVGQLVVAVVALAAATRALPTGGELSADAENLDVKQIIDHLARLLRNGYYAELRDQGVKDVASRRPYLSLGACVMSAVLASVSCGRVTSTFSHVVQIPR